MIKVMVTTTPTAQTFTCSDHSSGAVTVRPGADGEYYEFSFYAHAHPSFWVPASALVDGHQVRVAGVSDSEVFTLSVAK